MPLTLALLHFSLSRGDSRDTQATADMLCPLFSHHACPP